MPKAIDLSGKIAIVTGASRGIGRAIALTLAQHGCGLVLNASQSKEIFEPQCAELRDNGAWVVDWQIGSVADPATIEGLARKAFALGKRLDIMINNAGVMSEGLIGMIAEEEIDRVMAVNLKGCLLGIQAASRLMRRGSGGSIINVSSIMGSVGARGLLTYSASKAGILGATRAAAKELAPFNIRVNALTPGFIDTDMSRNISAESYAERLASIAMSRPGTAEDVANAALFLASDLSSYVTGQVLGIDGGMLI